METEMIKYIATQGAFALLFLWLLIDTRKDTKEREKQLHETIKENQDIIKENQNIIGKLTEKFNIVENIKDDIKEIKDKIFK